MKVKQWKNIFHENSNQRKVEVVILLNRLDFTFKKVTRDKDIRNSPQLQKSPRSKEDPVQPKINKIIKKNRSQIYN